MVRLSLIIIFISTLYSATSVPKLYESLGKKVASWSNYCIKLSYSDSWLNKECKEFVLDSKKAFDFGAKVAPIVDNLPLDDERLQKYASMLSLLDDKSENIYTYIKKRVLQSIDRNNTDNIIKLLSNIPVKEFDDTKIFDYIYTNKNVFLNSSISDITKTIISKKDEEIHKKIQREQELKEKRIRHNQELIKKAKNRLKKNIFIAKLWKEKGRYIAIESELKSIKGLLNNFNKRIEDVRDKCIRGEGFACTTYAKFLPKNKQVEWMEKGCNLGASSGCLYMANYNLFNKSIAKVLRKREYLFYIKRSCKYGSSKGCYLLSKKYNKNNSYYQKAFEYAKSECGIGDFEACYILATIYDSKKLYKEALKEYLKSCKGGVVDGCMRSADILIYKTKRVKDGINIWKSICMDNTTQSFRACKNLVDYYKRKNSMSDAIFYMDKLCKKDSKKYDNYCYKAGVAYRYGLDVYPNIQKSLNNLFPSCHKNHNPKSCYEMGLIYKNRIKIGGGSIDDIKYLKKLFYDACIYGTKYRTSIAKKACREWESLERNGFSYD